jgi:asparagine synthase (glutamine-hydrolysing)
MSGIAGIATRREDVQIGNLLHQMLETIRHHGLDSAGCVVEGTTVHRKHVRELNLEGKKGRVAIGHVKLSGGDGNAIAQPSQSRNGDLSILLMGSVHNAHEVRAKLTGEHGGETVNPCEVILDLAERYYQGHLTTAMQKILPQLEGEYSLAMTDQKETLIARDPTGLRQLYYFINRDAAVFASEKKPLLRIGGPEADIHRLEPGHLVIFNGKGFQETHFWNPDSMRVDDAMEDKARVLENYGLVFEEAVRRRIADAERVGIIFSGGIDSVLVAWMVKQIGVPLTCYTVGRDGGSDTGMARTIAAELDLPIKVRTLELDEIEKAIPEIVSTIEDHSLNQVEAAIAYFMATRMAAEAGESNILTGQGPDEIFGGYPWYSTIVDREGYESFERYSWEDTLLSYKETFERENKIAAAQGLEMSVPYVDPKVITMAFRVRPELKIKRGKDPYQKRIHREFALLRGIPEEIAFRKKEAAQHGANVHTALEDLAKKAGLTEGTIHRTGYDPDKSVIEKLGSSSRYGFRYGDGHLWKPLAHVQYYLDCIGGELNLLPPQSRDQWLETRRKLTESDSMVAKRGTPDANRTS